MGFEPELGHAAFGNAWSEHELPDSQVEVLWRLGEAIEAVHPHGANPMSNSGGRWAVPGLFEANAYFWGICEDSCGFEAREEAWCEANPHAPECFATRRSAFLDALEAERVPYGDRRAREEEWLASEGVPVRGWRARCDCGRDERLAGWLTGNGHDPRCGVVLPNFRHEPSGLEVRQYKHLGRDTSTNMELDDETFTAIVEECIRRVAEGHDGYGASK